MVMDLVVTSGVLATVLKEATRTAPQEACGLLLGDAVIREARPAANVAADPLTRFEIDPAALIAAHRAARQGGPGLLGYYHSHPNGHPRPSATDCEHAGGDGSVWAIAAAGEVTFWRDTPGGFERLSYRVVAG